MHYVLIQSATCCVASDGAMQSYWDLELKDRNLLQAARRDGQTPLHEAAEIGNARLVQAFLALGADTSASDSVSPSCSACAVHSITHGHFSGAPTIWMLAPAVLYIVQYDDHCNHQCNHRTCCLLSRNYITRYLPLHHVWLAALSSSAAVSCA